MWYEKMSELRTAPGLKKFVKKHTLNFLFEYETPKVVKVYSTRLGLINRTVQLLVLSYVIGYVFIHQKGYQQFEQAESNTVAKVKGMAITNFSQESGTNNIWDQTDLVIPAETDAFFITTNFIQTPSQKTSKCPEDRNVGFFAACKSDSDCPAGISINLGNGFMTGKCVNSTGTCEIEGWCPTENDYRPEPPLFLSSENFTVLIKNYISFPEFNVKRRNIPDWMTTKHIAECRYHPEKDPYCPIFVVGDMVKAAKENFSSVARTGAVFAFIIHWDCNLDYSEEHCLPKYSFRRMDSPNEKIAKGWNFRHADYWNDPNGVRRRTLYKYYGIRFVFMVYGKGGKFDPETFAMNLGSGIGLLGIATVLCEFLMDFLLKTDAFRQTKVSRIRDDGHKQPTLERMLGKHAAALGGQPINPEMEKLDNGPTRFSSKDHSRNHLTPEDSDDEIAGLSPHEIEALLNRRQSKGAEELRNSQYSLPLMPAKERTKESHL
ncbi:hypothetical protein RvY_06095 [Ramazzottius varieornatus]|uniref:Uncharacterized protein n=1 Tax=Ramazzottius varieornatus TaxID=947166 RepID=A0A1D1V0X0_RAMVA|nr:hypothetical protein RvY_06095 [Ramazzottius varieornatus]